MKNYVDLKFTRRQRMYFKQLLDDMVSLCDKDCYPQYYGFLRSSIQSIIAGHSILVEDNKNG